MTTLLLGPLLALAITSTMAEYTEPAAEACETPKAAKIQHTGKPHTPSFSIQRA